jgi:5-methylthioadenosine/S-adenosylhomocysteine deaminase
MERLAAQRFASKESLITLGIYSQPDAATWALARRLNLPILSELLGVMAPMLKGWQHSCPLGPDNIVHHCTSLPELGWRVLQDAGVQVTISARGDAQYALEGGVSAYQAALEHGFAPGLGCDMEAAYGGNIFTEMRVTFFIQRAMAQAARHSGAAHAPRPVSVEQILSSATLDGARCAGLAQRTGSLTPGKQADIILLDTGAMNLAGARHAAGAVVQAAESGNVDTVIVAGRLRKRGGELIGVDRRKLRRELDASMLHVFAAAGMTSSADCD